MKNPKLRSHSGALLTLLLGLLPLVSMAEERVPWLLTVNHGTNTITLPPQDGGVFLLLGEECDSNVTYEVSHPGDPAWLDWEGNEFRIYMRRYHTNMIPFLFPEDPNDVRMDNQVNGFDAHLEYLTPTGWKTFWFYEDLYVSVDPAGENTVNYLSRLRNCFGTGMGVNTGQWNDPDGYQGLVISNRFWGATNDADNRTFEWDGPGTGSHIFRLVMAVPAPYVSDKAMTQTTTPQTNQVDGDLIFQAPQATEPEPMTALPALCVAIIVTLVFAALAYFTWKMIKAIYRIWGPKPPPPPPPPPPAPPPPPPPPPVPGRDYPVPLPESANS